MLNMYQLWLDDLYPRAKFADALAIIEKVGHTKRMQMMRKEWIDEGKPRRSRDQDDEVDEIISEQPTADQGTENMEGVEHRGDVSQPDTGSAEQVPDRAASTAGGADDPDEDELDALLAESAPFGTSAPKTLPVRTNAAQEDPFADEMEAMAGMDDW